MAFFLKQLLMKPAQWKRFVRGHDRFSSGVRRTVSSSLEPVDGTLAWWDHNEGVESTATDRILSWTDRLNSIDLDGPSSNLDRPFYRSMGGQLCVDFQARSALGMDETPEFPPGTGWFWVGAFELYTQAGANGMGRFIGNSTGDDTYASLRYPVRSSAPPQTIIRAEVDGNENPSDEDYVLDEIWATYAVGIYDGKVSFYRNGALYSETEYTGTLLPWKLRLNRYGDSGNMVVRGGTEFGLSQLIAVEDLDASKVEALHEWAVGYVPILSQPAL